MPETPRIRARARRLRRPLVVLLALGLFAGVAYAQFKSSTPSAAQTISTATLAAPTPTSTHPNTSGAQDGAVALTLPAVSPALATTYDIQRATAPGGPFATLVTVPASTSAYADTTAPYDTQQFYRVVAHRSQWTTNGALDQAFSLPISAGSDATGNVAGTALSGPWTNGGSALGQLAAPDATRYTTARAWGLAPTGGTVTLYAVSAATATQAWAVGQNGAVLETFDGGASWTPDSSGTGQTLRAVSFVDASHGWAVGNGGTILATADGGATWTAQASGTGQNLYAVQFLDASRGWVVGNGGTIRTTADGGATWTAQTSGIGQRLYAVSFVNATTGWAVGQNGTILHTADGGVTWAAQVSGLGGGSTLRSVDMTDATHGVIVGNAGIVLTTTNGSTWTQRASGTGTTLRHVVAFAAGQEIAVGSGGTVLTSATSGVSWTARTSGVTDTLYGADFADALHGFAVGANDDVLATTDGGVTWQQGSTQRLDLTVLAPSALAPGGVVTGVRAALVYRTSATPSAGTAFRLLASADGGTTWSSFALPVPGAANADVSTTVDLSPLGFSPASRVQTIALRFVVTVPAGGTTFTTSHDLAHVDVN